MNLELGERPLSTPEGLECIAWEVEGLGSGTLGVREASRLEIKAYDLSAIALNWRLIISANRLSTASVKWESTIQRGIDNLLPYGNRLSVDHGCNSKGDSLTKEI